MFNYLICLRHLFSGFFVVLIICSVSSAQSSELIINEFMAANGATIEDEDGNNKDWIELYNNGSGAVNLKDYHLTDDPNEMLQWQFPDYSMEPGEYLVVFASGKDRDGEPLHTNFSLSRGGEYIGLTDAGGALMDEVVFGEQITDVSYGRQTDDPGVWVFFEQPTPGAENGSGYHELTVNPEFSLEGGLYNNSIEVTLTNYNSGADIYYTLDGSAPNEHSTRYTDPIPIHETTAIRAVVKGDGLIDSETITHTYFINEDANLSLVSLNTHPDSLFSDEYGIYVSGTNGISGLCDEKESNFNQDWEREVNLEFFEKDGEQVVNQRVGLKIFGGCSRSRYPQKSFSVYARSEYGNGSIDHQLFEEKSIEEFESILLRSSADDQVRTMLKDAYAQHVLLEHMDVDYQAYRPVIVYINGVYWGIHNMREKINKDYLASNYGVDPLSVNILSGEMFVHRGSADEYRDMFDFANTKDLAITENYEHVAALMDIPQYTDYQMANIHMAEEDWPGNNIKYWNSSEPDHRQWRWIMYDRDQTFRPSRIDTNALALATAEGGNTWPNPDWSTRLFRNLLDNANFKNRFIQTYAYHLNTTFQPERLHQLLDTFIARIADEIPNHIDRWGGQLSEDTDDTWVPPTFNSVEEWNGKLDEIRDFIDNRTPPAIDHLMEYFELDGMADLNLTVNYEETGTVYLYDKKIRDSVGSGAYFSQVPLQLTVEPNPGYKFSHWVIITPDDEKTVTSQALELSLTDHTDVTAHFEAGVPSSTAEYEKPGQFELKQNYPNPFNPTTRIEYHLTEAGSVQLEVLDTIGRRVALLASEEQQKGQHTVLFDASSLSSGVYLYRLRAPEGVRTRIMTLIK